jgi:DNA polymerase-3 subunit delta
MIITLTGENAYDLGKELKNIVQAFTKENDQLAVETIDAEEADIARINESINGISFLAPKKLIIIRSPSKNKELPDSISKILESVSEEVTLVFVDPKIDKRSSMFKSLKSKTDFKEFTTNSSTLPKWIVSEVKARGGSINVRDSEYLLSRTGPNQELISNELDKLILYSSDINLASIDLMTVKSPQSTIFELLEAAFGGNKKRLMQLYKEQRELKVEAQQIIAMLVWQIHLLNLLKSSSKSISEVAAESKSNPYVLRKSQNLVNKFSMQQLKDLTRKLKELDLKLKTKSVDPDEVLELYLLQLTVL